MGLGEGTNNYVELLALKLLLCFSLENNYRKLQIFGDSLIVINWVKKVQSGRNISLISLFEEVSRLTAHFDSITCRHVYRERNTAADRLSKQGLTMDFGTWKFVESRGVDVYEFFHRTFIENQLLQNG